MGRKLDRIHKRNIQIYEIYRQALIIEAAVCAEKSLEKGGNPIIENTPEAVGLLLHCLEHDRRSLHLKRKDGLHKFAQKYRLPIFKYFQYKVWQRRLGLLCQVLTTPRSHHNDRYDEIPVQHLYPGLSAEQRYALIQKDFQRIGLRFPRLGTLLKRQEQLRSNLTSLTSQEGIGESGMFCVSYRHSSDHSDLGIGYCKFGGSVTVCSGKPSFCTRMSKPSTSTNQEQEFDPCSLSSDQVLPDGQLHPFGY
jgi:hypothetical protein